jgi:dTDP-4-amino-4,6-dideoxygalactose transaminase
VATTFSFYPSKNLFALGDGGLVATDDEELADRVWKLHFHGSSDKQTFEYVGVNSRLDEIQAAALRVFLPHVEAWNAGRRAAAARYADLGLGELCVLPVDESGHVYHMYVVRFADRDHVAAALREQGVVTAAYYKTSLHLQPALAYLGHREGSLPETERAAAENLALPLWPGMPAEAQERVVEAVRTVVPAAVH